MKYPSCCSYFTELGGLMLWNITLFTAESDSLIKNNVSMEMVFPEYITSN